MLPIFGIFSILQNKAEESLLAIVLIFLGWLVKKHLLPLLNSETKKKIAEHVLLIADDVTDWLTATYPDQKPYKYLDKAIDKIMEVCGVSREVAERAAKAALKRKGVSLE